MARRILRNIPGPYYDLPDIRTEDIEDGAVTADKLNLGAATATVSTSQGTTSTTYTDLATAGPTVTVTVGANGLLLVHFGCQLRNNTVGEFSLMALALSGANTEAAGDANGTFSHEQEVANSDLEGGTSRLYTGLTPGSTTVTAKYRVGGGSGTFGRRYVIATPL